MMLNCRDATRLVSDALEQELPFGRRLSLRLHLLLCPPCMRFARQLARLERLFSSYGGAYTASAAQATTLSAAAKERMAREIAARE